MNVLVIGANGKIGRQLIPLLVNRGHEVTAMVRDAAQSKAHEESGAGVVVADLESDFAQGLSGRDAVVFTAGSGGHTGADKTMLVDLWGALKSIDAAVAHGVRRYVMVSSVGAGDPDSGRPAMRPYLVAKHLADDALRRAALDWTIVRPGRLNDADGCGRVNAGADIGYGEVPRADVAATLAAVLDERRTFGKTFTLLTGLTTQDQFDARKYLAATYMALGDAAAARAQLSLMVVIEPDQTLDPSNAQRTVLTSAAMRGVPAKRTDAPAPSIAA